MEKIKRYTTHWSAEMTEWSKDGVEIEGGEWVRYDDHKKEVDRLWKRIKELDKKHTSLVQRIWFYMKESD